ncbi:alpha/beta hydrolase [candidate division KSB1 bacterium]|nr:alpha/beta hydrolase [candidate division KSB1 bacterium]NIR71998.1 alpha/beta hydrolase [candidate division KSB1 bacterium]NIS24991.1 alpha/beta hydrolase [candidate division KSB1 bacterium]NIT71907.1 alpha/beta hydrolase [candidate division KSB1 bacterium]NIU25646.1 alpha/beta hydrolase [candidate division KSB1 bacterium]
MRGLTVETKELRFEASKSSGEVSAILIRPTQARWLLVLGHGAGAGMRHAFMENISQHLAANGIATFRYQFPYMEQGKKAPNPPPILMKTIRSAVATAAEIAGDLPILAGGKSLGGRMTSNAAASEAIPDVKGIVFFGFPLHAPGKPSSERGNHLFEVTVPMLFLQGTRDKLADLDYLKPLCDKLDMQAKLHIVEGADHSFRLPKKLNRTEDDVFAELAETVLHWAAKLGRI